MINLNPERSGVRDFLAGKKRGEGIVRMILLASSPITQKNSDVTIGAFLCPHALGWALLYTSLSCFFISCE